MRFEPFLLDQWIEGKFDSRCSIEFDLTSSAGRSRTWAQLTSMERGEAHTRLKDLELLLSAVLCIRWLQGLRRGCFTRLSLKL